MKKSKLALLLGTLLSLFVLAGCPGPATGGGDTVTVTFNDNGNVTRTVTLTSGSNLASLPSNQLPYEPYKSYNYFMYWSESKDSLATAVEFDYNKPITENKTLYAIYTPQLAYQAIQSITSESIKIKLQDDNAFPLNDGSYAGITFMYSSKGTNYSDYEDCHLTIPSSDIDEGGYKYLTYTFPSPLTTRKNYFKVTNGHETNEKSFIGDIPPEKLRTVTFDMSGTTRQEDIAAGETISKPSDPYKSYNHFMYWSKSKASMSEASEFDFSTPITENTTLYAIFTPRLSSTAINSISESDITIVVYMYNSGSFTFEDGSYAGIKIQHSFDGINYEDYAVESIPAESGSDKLIFTFKNGLSKGLHYFKVTNGHETYSKSVDIKIAAEDIRLVNFVDNDSIKTEKVEAGKTISKPSDPYKSYNQFMYWSKSKASLAEIAEFDFSTPITENTTLYAIYKPTINSSSIEDFSTTQIEIKLSGTKFYPLEDGSYAGMKFQHSLDDINYEDYAVNEIPSNFYDTSSNRYLTYTFAEPLSLGTHYLKVISGNITAKKTKTITEPAPVQDLSTVVDDSYAKISFKTVEGWSSYTVQAFKNTTKLASKTISSSIATSSEKSVEFFGLDNGIEYTFKVLTDGTDKSAEITATPEIKQKESDWLLVMYMDGDNNLNDPIFLDLNEAEYGLYKVRNESSSNSVNVVALWDGVVNYKDENNSTVTPQIGKSGSYLYELGTDYSSTATYINDPGCILSNNTKNLSYTSWIIPNKTVTTSKPDTYGEVNMGDVNTLIEYLKWVNTHYKAKKGIILQFSNHGGGPRSATLKNNFGRRSMCWDDTSGTDYFLKTSDVSHALYEAGFSTSKKVKMIMEDVCLGGSLEEAYELKDYAEYYVGSPNNIPAHGFDYVAFVSSLTSTANIEEIGGKLVKSYKSDYTWSESDWKKFLTANQALNNSEVNEIMKSVFNSSLSTLSFINLSKIEAVKNAVEEYATLVKSASEEDELLKVDSNGNHYLVGQSSNIPDNATFVSINEAIKYHTALYGDPLYYEGTFGTLKDLGFMSFYLNTMYDETSNTTLINILSKANAITDALNNAIIACWRDGYNKPTYYKNLQDSSNSGLAGSWYGNDMGFGLTINCSCWVPHTGADGKTYLYEDFAEWYSNELAFGKDCSAWTNLIKDWFKK